MAKIIEIPEYVLSSVLRHYRTLADVDVPRDNIKAVNAKRVANKEISKVERLIQKQQNHE